MIAWICLALCLLLPSLARADVDLRSCSHSSLEKAIAEAQPGDTVWFRCSGDIALRSDLQVRKAGLTFDGSQSPNGGVQFTGGYRFVVMASNTTVRHLRFRPGHSEDGVERDAIEILSPKNVAISNILIENVSSQWALDGVLDIAGYYGGSVRNVTVRDSLFAEGRNAFVVVGDISDIRIVNNLFHSNSNRNPQISAGSGGAPLAGIAAVEIRGNIVSNHIYGARLDARDQWRVHATVDGNQYFGSYMPGVFAKIPVEIHPENKGIVRVALGRNTFWGRRPGEPECLAFQRGSNQPCDGREPFAELVSGFSFEPDPSIHLEKVLAKVGATLPCRDRVDRRIIQEVRDRTGHFPKEPGPWPQLDKERCEPLGAGG